MTEDRAIDAPVGALARTVLLLREFLPADTPDAGVAAALRALRVTVIGDRANLASAEGQHALVTAALLMARSGASIRVEVPDLPLVGVHAPLRGERLGAALTEVLGDLLPSDGAREQEDKRAEDKRAEDKRASDLVILVGDTPWHGSAHRTLRLSGDGWTGAIAESGGGSRWSSPDSPFGALAAAGLAAGEAFKLALDPLRDRALDREGWDLHFAPSHEATVRLAPEGTPAPRGELGVFDCVSGGAIIQSALYALLRIPGVRGETRVIEPESGELTNLNRYAFLRRSHLGYAKARDVAAWLAPQIAVTSIVDRFDDVWVDVDGPLRPVVLVGVDDIPSRWRVQATHPCWLGIGATSHFSAMASVHIPGWGCAQCLHPHDEPGDDPIPTAAFISHWAGLWLASYFARMRSGHPLRREQQSVFMSPLRPEGAAGLWMGPVAVREGCPQGHRAEGGPPRPAVAEP